MRISQEVLICLKEAVNFVVFAHQYGYNKPSIHLYHR